jgi:hypothetical protein
MLKGTSLLTYFWRARMSTHRCFFCSEHAEGDLFADIFLEGEDVNTSVFLLNRSPTRALDGVTPYEAWTETKPPVHYLCIFGCVAHVKVIKPHPHKLWRPLGAT